MWADGKAEEILRQLWPTGKSASAIALEISRALGIPCSRNAVIGKVHRIGLELRGKQEHRAPRRPTVRRQRPTTNRPISSGKSAPVFVLEPYVEIPDEPIPFNERKGILDLEKDDCRWPVGDPQNADFHFCNQKQVPGTSYCAHHLQRAFQSPKVLHRHPERPAENVRTPSDLVDA